MKFNELLNSENIIFLDGAFGTLLQEMGLKNGACPEEWNLLYPEKIRKIHKLYVQTGVEIINTNTFGGSRLKLKEFGLESKLAEINTAGVKIARDVSNEKVLVAASIGPTGQLLEPFGKLSFNDCIDNYREQAKILAASGADIFNVETMSDIGELKACIIGIRDVSDKPIFANITFEDSMRTLTGSTPEIIVTILNSLPVEVIGTNCGFGPDKISDIIERYTKLTRKPIMAEPNAGLPELINGKTVFNLSPEKYVNIYKKIIDNNIKIAGGCCGTTPDHINLLIETYKTKKIKQNSYSKYIGFASRTRLISKSNDTHFIKIGEKINPSAVKKLQEELANNSFTTAKKLAIQQQNNNADLLDVNVSVPGLDEPDIMKKMVSKLQEIVDIPLCIDSSNVKSLEIGMRNYIGKGILNSVTGETSKLDRILPLAKKYGFGIIALTIDEDGIPKTAEKRLHITEKIVKHAHKYGIPEEDIIIDPLTLTVSTKQKQALETLESIRLIKSKYNVLVSLGLSNISYGLPNRGLINIAFLIMAIQNGLDMAILNVLDKNIIESIYSANTLMGIDKDSLKYIELFSAEKTDERELETIETDKDADIKKVIYNSILKGYRDQIIHQVNQGLNSNISAQDILNSILIPAITYVGDLYGEGKYFLPQLILSAETLKNAMIPLKPYILEKKSVQHNAIKILLATVQGDIHDIGKNIVKIMFENEGYIVNDLGKDVPIDKIKEKILSFQPDVVGLSALMTTTMENMKPVINFIYDNRLNIKIIVGGAAVTQKYADEIKADAYASDAVSGVKIVKKLCTVPG